MVKAVAAVAWLVVSSAFGAGALFPTPLHEVRNIVNPFRAPASRCMSTTTAAASSP